MQTASFKLVEAEMDFVSKSTLTKSFHQRLPGSRTRLLCNQQISIFEEYLETGKLESYCYQLEVSSATTIHFDIRSPQTHLLYHLAGRTPIHYSQPQVNAEFIFRPQHGAFFYAPETIIALKFEPGKYHIQGFTLPLDLLQIGGVPGFAYLASLIAAHKGKLAQYRVSLDFAAMEQTRRIFSELTEELNKKPLIPKSIILHTIQDLLLLSKNKLLKAAGLLSHQDLLVEQARELISKRIAETEEMTWIKDIADSLHIQEDQLNRYHMQRYGETLLQYRNRELLKKAKHLLCQDLRVHLVSDLCGFGQISSFSRFFKSESGLSPKKFQYQMRPPKDSS
ncbi:helix-turn-helix domain-containing protein [Sphingobacterium siyangense]|uniref:Helix-turn-helix protein n=1 Tax=Sphingobacterium siyangense TaxID=459529 RepID=A0A562MG27_9SPHI|nr:helix-turn-helix domain-containing protein [Sphingobacterium siyangense]TWI18897.1 helix-turn-helix protein [Sphingobacterium siyangense]